MPPGKRGGNETADERDRPRAPRPRRLLAWLRILLAAQMLEDAGRTRASAAAACGYRTDRSLRRLIQRFVGSGSGQPLLDAAAQAFNRELRQRRENVRAGAAGPGRVANPMQAGDVQSYPTSREESRGPWRAVVEGDPIITPAKG